MEFVTHITNILTAIENNSGNQALIAHSLYVVVMLLPHSGFTYAIFFLVIAALTMPQSRYAEGSSHCVLIVHLSLQPEYSLRHKP